MADANSSQLTATQPVGVLHLQDKQMPQSQAVNSVVMMVGRCALSYRKKDQAFLLDAGHVRAGCMQYSDLTSQQVYRLASLQVEWQEQAHHDNMALLQSCTQLGFAGVGHVHELAFTCVSTDYACLQSLPPICLGMLCRDIIRRVIVHPQHSQGQHAKL